MKKGVELSLTVVVIAALLLLVLIVMISIFGKYMGQGTRDIDTVNEGIDCPSTYLGCDASSIIMKPECSSGEIQIVGNFKAYREGMVCCCQKT